MNVTIADNAIN